MLENRRFYITITAVAVVIALVLALLIEAFDLRPLVAPFYLSLNGQVESGLTQRTLAQRLPYVAFFSLPLAFAVAALRAPALRVFVRVGKRLRGR